MNNKYNLKNIARYWLGGKIKRFCFRIYEKFFPVFKIDKALIIQSIKNFNLDKTTILLKKSYKNLIFNKKDNKDYFNNILNWVNADKYLPDNPFFLYPPNLAAMDFILKNAKKDDSILDYGCGLSHLLVYLRQMGFSNTFGYDDFSQVKHQTINKFLDNFNLSDIILTKQRALGFKTNIALCICYFWSKLDRDLINKETNNPNIRYILLDHYYAPRRLKNFKIAGIYKNLLIVFQRKNEKSQN